MSQTQAAIGPAMNPEEEAAHRRSLRDLYLTDAMASVAVIEEKKRGIEASLAAAKAEVARLEALGDEPGAGEI